MSVFPVANVSDLDMAFPVSVYGLMPKYSEIPDEFKYGRNIWCQLVSEWFFRGVVNLQLTPNDGIDKSDALRHITAVMGSFEPKHEHKEAACAYLLSQWFTDPKWEHVKK